MDEYIEREALKEVVTNLRFGKHLDKDAALNLLDRAIDNLPAADVVPVVHGRWEWREEWETHHETHSIDLISCGWYCTECGIELGEYLTEKTGQRIILDDDCCKPKLTRCPNCGAKMEVEVNHE